MKKPQKQRKTATSLNVVGACLYYRGPNFILLNNNGVPVVLQGRSLDLVKRALSSPGVWHGKRLSH